MFRIIKGLIFFFIPHWRFMNTYSQAGEDAVMFYFFNSIGIKKPTYLDIGACTPIYGNNTFLFYKRGSNGVCVEADPSLFPDIIAKRKKDICLNVGVTFDNRTEADFYLFENYGYNTLSKEEALFRNENSKYKIKEIIKIPLMNINKIIEQKFDKTPNLISIDTEGVDLDILKSLDFEKHAPDVICAETITFSETNNEQKVYELLDFVKSKNYIIYGDTHINTIFVHKRHFPNWI